MTARRTPVPVLNAVENLATTFGLAGGGVEMASIESVASAY